MNTTEIKKALYKQKPMAKFQYVRGSNIYYKATVTTEKTEDSFPVSYNVDFEVPVADIGDADFLPEMNAQYLNRYLVKM